MYNSGAYKHTGGVHSDLWAIVNAEVERAARRVRVKWVKAHMTASGVVTRGVTLIDLYGNTAVDIMAKAGAKLNQAPPTAAYVLTAHEQLAWQARARLVALNLHYMKLLEDLPQELRPERSQQAPRGVARTPRSLRRDKALQLSSHQLCFNSKEGRCSVCGQGRALKDFTRWLEANSECPGRPTAVNGAAPDTSDLTRPLPAQQYANLMIAETRVHPTHRVTHFRGLHWCWTCGSIASTGAKVLKGLKGPCKPPSKHGLDNLKRLCKDQYPTAGANWPEPESAHDFPFA